MNARTLALRISVFTVFALLAGPSLAGGLYLPTFGGPSQGTASAGANAIAPPRGPYRTYHNVYTRTSDQNAA
jgi:hypothetical protein